MCVWNLTRPYPHADSNDFQQTGFALGSVEITEIFSECLANRGRDELTRFMNNIKGERGAEAVCGVLFEHYTHALLRNGDKELNIRVVRRGGDGKLDGYASIKIPVGPKVLRFSGQEAVGIKEATGVAKLPVGTYILPESRTFPTYDAAVVVPGQTVGMSGKNVGLLLQMTVSGATGISRKPKHSVKHYMRQAMDKAVKETDEGSAEGMVSYATFCVPSECFFPFVYQPEELKGTNDPVAPENQADFQFVIEIPEFTRLPQSTRPPEELYGGGKVHIYELRSAKRTKVDVAELYLDE